MLPLAMEAAIAAFQLDVSPLRRLRAAVALAAVGVLPRRLACPLIRWIQYPEQRRSSGTERRPRAGEGHARA
ncbi:hypothetical protein D3C72_2458370 [compost metagenome]